MDEGGNGLAVHHFINQDLVLLLDDGFLRDDDAVLVGARNKDVARAPLCRRRGRLDVGDGRIQRRLIGHQVDDEVRLPLADLLALGDAKLLDGARYLGVNVDVLPPTDGR